MRNVPGFTLVEMMVSMSILGILAGLSAPIYQSFLQRNDLDIAAQTVANYLRRAETYARANKSDTAWSVELQPTALTLFQGTTFTTRPTSADEAYTLPSTVTLSGLSEVQFAKLTATPNVTGNITLTSSTSDTKTVSINSEGMVDY